MLPAGSALRSSASGRRYCTVLPDSAGEIERRLQANDDPYLDPRWGVLANKVGARTQADLDAAEHDLSQLRALELAERPLKATFDEAHLREIHRYLFQDVYEWAGALRTVNTSKPDDSAGFFPCQQFRIGVPATFDQIQERNFRPGMDADEFVNKLSRTYDEINHLHPFREGNGRAQRIFLSQLADRAGFAIDWDSVTAARNDAVCRAAGHGDRGPMKAMLADVVHPKEAPPSVVRESRSPALRMAARRLREGQAIEQPADGPATNDSPGRSRRPRLADQARAYVEQQDKSAQQRTQATKADPGSIDRSLGSEGAERT